MKNNLMSMFEETKFELPIVQFDFDLNWYDVNTKYYIAFNINISRYAGLTTQVISKKLFNKKYSILPEINISLLYSIPEELAQYITNKIETTFKDKNVYKLDDQYYTWCNLSEGDIYIDETERTEKGCNIFKKVLINFFNKIIDDRDKCVELVELVDKYTKATSIETKNSNIFTIDLKEKILKLIS